MCESPKAERAGEDGKRRCRHIRLFRMARLQPDREKSRGHSATSIERKREFRCRVWIAIGDEAEHKSVAVQLTQGNHRTSHGLGRAAQLRVNVEKIQQRITR